MQWMKQIYRQICFIRRCTKHFAIPLRPPSYWYSSKSTCSRTNFACWLSPYSYRFLSIPIISFTTRNEVQKTRSVRRDTKCQIKMRNNTNLCFKIQNYTKSCSKTHYKKRCTFKYFVFYIILCSVVSIHILDNTLHNFNHFREFWSSNRSYSYSVSKRVDRTR